MELTFVGQKHLPHQSLSIPRKAFILRMFRAVLELPLEVIKARPHEIKCQVFLFHSSFYDLSLQFLNFFKELASELKKLFLSLQESTKRNNHT